MKKVQNHNKPTFSPVEKIQELTRNNKWAPLAVILVLIGALTFLKFAKGTPSLNTMKTKVLPDIVKKVVNNPGTKIEINSVKEVSGMIEFELSVNGQKYTSYTSRDGKLLFTSGIKVDDLNKPAAAAGDTTKTEAKDIKKADKPNVTAFVVADCPYGLQMQRTFKKAIAELPDLAGSLSVKYIGAVENGKITSMHGDKEAQENLKQICIRDEQEDKYWPYVSCYMQEGKTEDCLASTGVNTAELESCTTDAKRGLTYAQADFDLANKYKVTGSPTLLANGSQTVSEFDFGGRNPDAIKALVCAASKTPSAYCSQELSKTDMAVSLSVTDEAAAGATTGTAAGCAPAN